MTALSLHDIVAALGGDLYQGGRRANVPAPGHSAADRSISLLASDGRLIIHSFGAADWRDVRDRLAALGLIDPRGRLMARGMPGLDSRGEGMAEPRPDRLVRVTIARRLWEGAVPLTPGCLSHRYLASRSVGLDPAGLQSLRHHPAAPLSVFRTGARTRPALAARITAPDGRMTAIELVYLEPDGRRADRLRLPRKTVGVVPPGSAVRLAPQGPDMVVGEGVLTVLSASERFGLPGWALMAARNLAAWTPPDGVRRVLIAADRGTAGETAADRLRSRLRRLGLAARMALPPEPSEDWNAAAAIGRGEEGR